jgi:hypothetical protein
MERNLQGNGPVSLQDTGTSAKCQVPNYGWLERDDSGCCLDETESSK